MTDQQIKEAKLSKISKLMGDVQSLLKDGDYDKALAKLSQIGCDIEELNDFESSAE